MNEFIFSFFVSQSWVLLLLGGWEGGGPTRRPVESLQYFFAVFEGQLVVSFFAVSFFASHL